MVAVPVRLGEGDDTLAAVRAPRPVAPWAAAALTAAAAALWLPLALGHHGIVWPDEIYQSLEQGHRLAFGYGFVPWEFQVGARSWLFPGVLAALLKAAAVFGFQSGEALVIVAKTFMVLVSLSALVAAVRIAGALAGPRAALIAGTLMAAFPPFALMAGRCLTELPSAALLTFAVERLLRPGPRRSAVAGVLAGLAVALRPQNAIVALGLGVWLAVADRRRALFLYLAALLATAAAGGLLDWATWGAPFHAVTTYVRYNLIEHHADDYGTAPAWFYGSALWSATGPALLAIAAGLAATATARGAGRALLLTLAAYLAAHTAVAHKELRFLLPVAPLALALAGAGIDRLLAWPRWLRSPRAARIAGWLVCLGLGGTMAVRVPRLTFAEIGRPAGEPGAEDSAWDRASSFNQLLLEAGRAPDLCGLLVVGPDPIWLGGYSYLHRDVPFFSVPAGAVADGWPEVPFGANYVIAPAFLAPPAPAVTVARAGALRLVRVPRSCGPPPTGYSRLFAVPE